MTIYATAPAPSTHVRPHTDAGRKPNKHAAARAKARSTNKLIMDAPTLVDFGLDGLLRWAHKNQLRSATITYSNGTTFTGDWVYNPAKPGHREALALVDRTLDQTVSVALRGVWSLTNDLNPTIRSLTGHK